MSNLIGTAASWPYAQLRLTSGSVLWVGPGVKAGVVNIYADGSVEMSLFTQGSDEFSSSSGTVRRNEQLSDLGVTVTVVEVNTEESPRWIRIVAERSA